MLKEIVRGFKQRYSLNQSEWQKQVESFGSERLLAELRGKEKLVRLNNRLRNADGWLILGSIMVGASMGSQAMVFGVSSLFVVDTFLRLRRLDVLEDQVKFLNSEAEHREYAQAIGLSAGMDNR